MTTISTRLDKTAISISALCVVHCLLLPVGMVLLPSVTVLTVLSDELFHIMMIAVVLPTSAIALTLGCKRHKSLLVVTLGSAGLLILGFAAFFGHGLLGEAGEKVTTVIGACMVAASHWQNFRLCKKLDCSA